MDDSLASASASSEIIRGATCRSPQMTALVMPEPGLMLPRRCRVDRTTETSGIDVCGVHEGSRLGGASGLFVAA